jgi:outer membrane protein
MKNLSIILNVVLLVAVVFLYIDKYSGDGNASQTVQQEADTTAMFENVAIAYVHSDSLLANYEYMKEIESEIGELSSKYEKEYQNRAQNLQSEINDFQRTAQNLTVAQGRALEENLMKKRQDLARYQENLSIKLRQKEMELNDQLYKSISDYLQKYGSENDLQLVLTYSRGSDVLYANEGLEITKEVIAGLNEAYLAENKSAEEEK